MVGYAEMPTAFERANSQETHDAATEFCDGDTKRGNGFIDGAHSFWLGFPQEIPDHDPSNYGKGMRAGWEWAKSQKDE